MGNNPQLNSRPGDGVSWEIKYGIDGGNLTNVTRENFAVSLVEGVLPHAVCVYSGASALTLSEFNAFEVNSTILAAAITTPALYLKIDATTWKYQAINT